jgi:hypothetical protein
MQRHQLVLGTLIALGCSGRTIDVGGMSSGSAAQGGAPALLPSDCVDTTPLPSWPDSSSCVASSDLPLTGIWRGYVENTGAPWDKLTLVITGASIAGGVCGTLSIGAGPPPAAATDPTVGYPPGVGDNGAGGGTGATPFLSAYPLTVLTGTTDGARVQFAVSQDEPYRGWCQLQTSLRASDQAVAGCNCLPDWPEATEVSGSSSACKLLDPARSKSLTVDCGKMALCYSGHRVCACNASGCDGTPNGYTVGFDLRFAANSAVGSNTDSTTFPTDFARAQ